MNSGGAERVVANLANSFSTTNNIDVYILMISMTKAISFYELNASIRLSVLSEEKVYTGFKKIREMKNYFSKNNFDIVISFLPNPIIYSFFALKKTQTKLICSERSNPKKYHLLKKALLKYVFKKVNGSVFQTENALNFYKCKGIVIYNPINQLGSTSNNWHKKEVCFIGSYRKVKNFKLLFESFGYFHDEFPDYKLRIFGVEKNDINCINQVKKYNLENAVILEGKKQNVQNEIAQSSLYISTSLYEGMSNSVLEAASLGIPCVVTNCEIGGNYEIAKHYKNVRLSSFDPVDFSRKMSEMVSKFEKPKIENEFSLDYVSTKWLDYITLVLEAGK